MGKDLPLTLMPRGLEATLVSTWDVVCVVGVVEDMVANSWKLTNNYCVMAGLDAERGDSDTQKLQKN